MVKRAIKRTLRREHSYDEFEPSGNYVHRINVRDVARSMTALGYHSIAWKTMNTFWYAPFDSAKRGKPSLAWVGSRLGIFAQDIACFLRLLSPGVATVICFKSPPATEILDALHSNAFRVKLMSVNPYI